MKFKHFALFTITACVFLMFARDAQSCSVPVFRYALERWKPDAYKGVFLFRGEIEESDQLLLQRLKEASGDGEAPLNLVIREVNADTFDTEKLVSLFQGKVPESLPCLAVWYPEQMGKKPPFLREKITPSLVEGLVQSPKRLKLAESLIGGASVVWIFMPSGNGMKDESALNLIRRELDGASAVYAKAPFTILSGAERKRLVYGFPVLTLTRDDPAERIFMETLMKSESDLYEHTDEPMAFPVFGRGRVLGCLFGEYITPQRIQEATAFLSSACSCEAKELNPGVDLLVAAPWDRVVMESFIEEEPLPELTGVLPERDETRDHEKTAANSNDPPAENSGLFRIYALSMAGVVLIVAVSSVVISRRRRNG